MDISMLLSLKFEKIYMIFLFIPLFVVMLILLIINFVHFDEIEKRKKRKQRFWIFLSRSAIIVLLVIALTSPFLEKKESTDGNPEIMLLYDNSSSMQLYNFDIDTFKKQLEDKVPTQVKYIGNEISSPIGDEIFKQLHKKNLLLISDGNNQKGSIALQDVAVLANKFNTTINVLKLDENKKDTSIIIDGAKTAIIDTEYPFKFALDNLKETGKVQVVVDNKVIFEKDVSVDKTPLSYKFTTLGDHLIVAKFMSKNNDGAKDNTASKDHFEINNIYYKVVEVVEKPKVLYISSKTSIIDDILQLRYNVVKQTTLPQSLNGFFAIVINDRMNAITDEESKKIESFVDDGNGLVVIGGENSFNVPSHIDLLLPVQMGTKDEKNVAFNFLLLLDASGFTPEQLSAEEQVASQILLQLNKRKEKINAGIMRFAHDTKIISDFADISLADAMVKKMIDLDDVSIIEGVVWYRPANLDVGIRRAGEMYKNIEGNNNIIVISDGAVKQDVLLGAIEYIKAYRDKGIRIHSYHHQNLFLDDNALIPSRQAISSYGRGLYIKEITDIDKLFEKNLIISDQNHWITYGLPKLDASLVKFNKVIPTAYGQTLVTTGTGVPIITTNSYNRVAVISTDDGAEWAQQLFSKNNLYLSYRVFDWAVGDPNRNKETYVRVEDAIVNQKTQVQYKGKSVPISDKCNFVAVEDYSECYIVPTTIGIDQILNKKFNVNYPEEYIDIGYNEDELKVLTQKTGGSFFTSGDIQNIVEKTKNSAKVDIIKKIYIDWYFVIAAIAIFLTEIVIRKIAERIRE
ncbi:VWA domain-containing protein [Candidatus Woesearchaeota archaeon]|nr:VWA domain-containing protein [Candidatus Woesearchaeota archaeon]